MLVSLKALLQIKHSTGRKCLLVFRASQLLVPIPTPLDPKLCTLTHLPLLPSIQVCYKCESQIGTMWTIFRAVVDGECCKASQNSKNLPGMENKQQMLQCHRIELKKHNLSTYTRRLPSRFPPHAACRGLCKFLVLLPRTGCHEGFVFLPAFSLICQRWGLPRHLRAAVQLARNRIRAPKEARV